MFCLGKKKKFHNSLPKKLVTFLKALSERSILLGVRGNFTAEVLESLGIYNTCVVGCPTMYECGPKRIIEKSDRIDDSDILLSHYIPLKTEYLHYQVCQDFQDEDVIQTIAFNRKIDYKSPKIDKILEKRYLAFSSIEDWKRTVSHFKFIIGPRIHGAILAMNCGIPAICTNDDSRAGEMCDFMELPLIKNLNNYKTITSLINEIDFESSNKRYPKIYQKFKDFMEINSLPVNDQHALNNFKFSQPSFNLYSSRCFLPGVRQLGQMFL